MHDPEQTERVRQAIMRFRELLDIMAVNLEAGEREYARLFAALPDADRKDFGGKPTQGRLAEILVDDPSPLSAAVGRTRFNARELERAFAELYNITTTLGEEA